MISLSFIKTLIGIRVFSILCSVLAVLLDEKKTVEQPMLSVFCYPSFGLFGLSKSYHSSHHSSYVCPHHFPFVFGLGGAFGCLSVGGTSEWINTLPSEGMFGFGELVFVFFSLMI